MNYAESVKKFQGLNTMLMNLQYVLAELRAEVNMTISDLHENQKHSEQVKEFFVRRNIKFIEGDKKSYVEAINRVSTAEKWRPITLKKALKELESIYEYPTMTYEEESETLEVKTNKEKQESKNQKQKHKERKAINETKLRRLIGRYGVNIEDDFDRESIIERVILKSVEQNWRKDTFDRNIDTIYKALDKNPLTSFIDKVPELVEIEEPYSHVYHGMTD